VFSVPFVVIPSCFIVLTDETVIVEQYHYGSSEPGANILGGKVPLLEFAADSQTYTQLAGHFQYLWDEAGLSIPGDEWLEEHREHASFQEELEPQQECEPQEHKPTPK